MEPFSEAFASVGFSRGVPVSSLAELLGFHKLCKRVPSAGCQNTRVAYVNDYQSVLAVKKSSHAGSCSQDCLVYFA